jgi:hypothetical protein
MNSDIIEVEGIPIKGLPKNAKSYSLMNDISIPTLKDSSIWTVVGQYNIGENLVPGEIDTILRFQKAYVTVAYPATETESKIRRQIFIIKEKIKDSSSSSSSSSSSAPIAAGSSAFSGVVSPPPAPTALGGKRRMYKKGKKTQKKKHSRKQ